MDSNILIKSNVYPVDADSPLFDKKFIDQIQDYELLRSIAVGNRVSRSLLWLLKLPTHLVGAVP